tara:strand:- start:2488 stop:3948 length:1461 start_codon:yes stop_codon:yes gene_type:complete
MQFPLNNIGNISTWEDGKTYTGKLIDENSSVVAKKLKEMNISSGDKVLIYHGNSAHFFSDLFGVWKSGACAVCLNSNLTESELINIISFMSPSLLLYKNDMQISHDLDIPCLDTRKLKQNNNSDNVSAWDTNIDSDALILFTSGTTGTPKGVVHTFRSLLSRITLNQSYIPLEAMKKTLCLLPTHFGHGLIGNCLTPLLAGCDLVIAPGHNLIVSSQLNKIIDDFNISFMSSVPALWKKVVGNVEQPEKDTLKRVHIGSAPLSSDLWENVIQWSNSKTVVNMYGITETANWIAAASSDKYTPCDGLVGDMWGGSAAILNKDEEISTVGEGELLIQSPSLFKEYFKLPNTTEAILINGWYRTGDIGRIDEKGTIYLTGREKYEINRAGIKVYPEDIDLLLERHGEIREACAFAIPDDIEGETIGVAISFINDSEQNLSDIQNWCYERLSREKVPVKWFIEEEIPKTDRGKLNRDRVAEHCLDDSKED